MNITTAKIIQIIPADGWAALHYPHFGEKENLYTPLICWALAEDSEGVRSIEGVCHDDDGQYFASELKNFGGYVKFNDKGEPYELTPD